MIDGFSSFRSGFIFNNTEVITTGFDMRTAEYVIVFTEGSGQYRVNREKITVHPKYIIYDYADNLFNSATLISEIPIQFSDRVGPLKTVDKTYIYKNLKNVIVRGYVTHDNTGRVISIIPRSFKSFDGIYSIGTECKKHFIGDELDELYKEDATFCVQLSLNNNEPQPKDFHGASVLDSSGYVVGLLIAGQDKVKGLYLASRTAPSWNFFKGLETDVRKKEEKGGKKGFFAGLGSRSKN